MGSGHIDGHSLFIPAQGIWAEGKATNKTFVCLWKKNSTFTRQCLFWRLQGSLCLRWCGEERKKHFPTPVIAQKRKKPKPKFAGILGRCHSECSGDICHRGLWSGPGDLGTRWADFFLTELFCVFERQYVCAHMCMSKSFFMYVHVQIYACVYLLAGMYVSVYSCVYLSIHVPIYLCLWACVCLYLYVSLCVYVLVSVHMSTCLCVSMYVYIHVSLHMYVCNCISLWLSIVYVYACL